MPSCVSSPRKIGGSRSRVRRLKCRALIKRSSGGAAIKFLKGVRDEWFVRLNRRDIGTCNQEIEVIVVPVVLDVQGKGKLHRNLCSVCIINDGTGTATRGNYDVKVMSKDMKLMREGRVENWPRKAKHVIDLVAECLKEIQR